MAKRYTVQVSGDFVVEIDETKFTEAFMAEFRQSFYPYDTLEEHVAHLAQLFGRGMIDSKTDFIEGYGPPAEMGIKFSFPGAAPWVTWVDVPVEVDFPPYDLDKR